VSAVAVGSSLVDALVRHLREQILTGKIAPGEKIVIRKVQGEFDISHIPVREALGRLEAEGLVLNLPRRGAIAAPVSVGELVDIYDLRRIIEPEFAVRSAKVMVDSQVEAIRVALDATDRASKAPNSERFIRANRRFHEAIVGPGSNPTIARTLTHLWRMSDRYLRLGMAIPDSVDVACRQHHEIFKAMRSRDEAAIRTTLGVHLTLADDAIRALELAEAATRAG
jgi:DNA-binding GntR family transcriptional regulator